MLVKYPSISILIPTLNSASVLEGCLKSIVSQDYLPRVRQLADLRGPKEKIEIIIGDGGSTDNTLKIAEKYGAKVYKNPLKTGEAGKAVAFKNAKNELVALIDSDNLLPEKDWLKKMVAPFSDKQIIGSEPWEYTYRKEDCLIDRYCALMGMNDPLCYFLGNYDRKNILSGKWTNLTLKEEDKGDWLKVKIFPPKIPTIGANGTVLRRKVLSESNLVGDYLFDIDILAAKAKLNPVYFAKVKTDIIHLFINGQGINKFVRKQRRRVKDYLYYQQTGVRKYPWEDQNMLGLLKFILACITVFPLLYQTLKGYLKKPDLAWFFHPVACWITLWVYGWGRIEGFWKREEISRNNWSQ